MLWTAGMATSYFSRITDCRKEQLVRREQPNEFHSPFSNPRLGVGPFPASEFMTNFRMADHPPITSFFASYNPVSGQPSGWLPH